MKFSTFDARDICHVMSQSLIILFGKEYRPEASHEVSHLICQTG